METRDTQGGKPEAFSVAMGVPDAQCPPLSVTHQPAVVVAVGTHHNARLPTHLAGALKGAQLCGLQGSTYHRKEELSGEEGSVLDLLG